MLNGLLSFRKRQVVQPVGPYRDFSRVVLCCILRLTYRHSCANAVGGVWSAGLKNDAVCWQ